MRKYHRLRSILILLLGTAFVLLAAGTERNKQIGQREAAEEFVEAAILFRSGALDSLSERYPEGMGEELVFDLKETLRCLDDETMEKLSEITFETTESRRISGEEAEKLESTLGEAGRAADARWIKVRFFIPGEETERVLECLTAAYDGCYGVWGIDTEGMSVCFWEEREKILLKEVFYDEEGRILDWEEYRYDAEGKPVLGVYRGSGGRILGKSYECGYDSGDRLVVETFYGSQEKEEVRYKYETYRQGEQVGEIRYEYRYTYEADDDDTGNRYWRMTGGGLYAERRYDRKQNKVRELFYGEEQKIETIWLYEYDGEGNETGSTRKACRDDGSIERIERYDEAGNLFDEKEYKENGKIDCWYKYEYGSAGNLLKKIREMPDGSRTEYEYDNVGNLLKETRYDSARRKENCETYPYKLLQNYDDMGRLATEMAYDGHGSCIYRCEYDGAGKPVKETGYSGGSQTILHEYKYDSAGNLTREMHSDGAQRYPEYSVYEYGRQGVLTREISYCGHTMIDITEEEYDAQGNRFRCSEYGREGTVKYCSECSRMMRGWYVMMRAWFGTPFGGMQKKNAGWERPEKLEGIEPEKGHGLEVSYYGDGTICGWVEYVYDEAWNPVEEIYCFRDGTKLAWYKWEYDDKGNPIRKSCSDIKGGTWDSREWEYDETGNVIKEVLGYGIVGEYEYDETGRLERVQDSGKLSHCYREYEYDEAGNRIKCVYHLYGLGGPVYEYEYDEAGNLTGEIYSAGGEAVRKRTYEYDMMGRQIRMSLYRISGGGESLCCYQEYEYDTAGNRKSRTIYHADGSVYIRTEYFYNGLRAG